MADSVSWSGKSMGDTLVGRNIFLDGSLRRGLTADGRGSFLIVGSPGWLPDHGHDLPLGYCARTYCRRAALRVACYRAMPPARCLPPRSRFSILRSGFFFTRFARIARNTWNARRRCLHRLTLPRHRTPHCRGYLLPAPHTPHTRAPARTAYLLHDSFYRRLCVACHYCAFADHCLLHRCLCCACVLLLPLPPRYAPRRSLFLRTPAARPAAARILAHTPAAAATTLCKHTSWITGSRSTTHY